MLLKHLLCYIPMQYLQQNSSNINNNNSSSKGLQLVELGSGTGLVGICLGRMLSEMESGGGGGRWSQYYYH